MILERLFGESFIKLGELHRYMFELVDAFVNNAAERAPCGIALGRTDRIYWPGWCVLGPPPGTGRSDRCCIDNVASTPLACRTRWNQNPASAAAFIARTGKQNRIVGRLRIGEL